MLDADNALLLSRDNRREDFFIVGYGISYSVISLPTAVKAKPASLYSNFVLVGPVSPPQQASRLDGR